MTISRDDVHCGVNPVGSTVTGPDATLDTILILKDKVNIEDLSVTGGFNGIRLQGPSYAGVTNVIVRNTANHGIIVCAGDIAIMNSTVEYAGGSGVMLSRGASARIVNSNFRDCHVTGITADGNSTVGVNGGTVSNNEGTSVLFSSGSEGGVDNAESSATPRMGCSRRRAQCSTSITGRSGTTERPRVRLSGDDRRDGRQRDHGQRLDRCLLHE